MSDFFTLALVRISQYIIFIPTRYGIKIMKTLKIQENKSGLKYGLVQISKAGFLVYVKKTNYVRGKNVERWVCCNKPRQDNGDFQKMAKEGMSFDDAMEMFNKKINGKAKN